jgi:uncharacterized membrane protein HdeD (DUF308 family)
LVAGAKLPLSFIALGLVCLMVAAVFACWQPALILQPFLHPHVVGWVHLWLPGFLLSVCMGAVYQLMPVVLGSALRLPLGAAWAHLGLHATGIVLLVTAFYTAQYGMAGLGGVLVTIGALILCAGIARTFLASDRRDAPAWSFPLAATWLGATVILGVVMALNRRAPFLSVSVLSLIKAHAHLGLVGFFLSLLQGTAFQLVPMFTMGTLSKPQLIWAGLVGTQLGLLLLAPGLAFEVRPFVVVGAAILVGAIAASGVALVATFRTRRRKVLEPGLKAFAIGAIIAAVSAATGFGLLWRGGFDARAAVAYLVLCVIGVLSFTVLGMLCKIIPFLVWMRAYGPHVGKRPVPLAPSLGSHTLERTWLWLHLAGLVATLAGVLTQVEDVVTFGAVSLACGVVCFMANVVRIVRHLWLKPEPVPSPRPAAPQLCSP